MDMQGSKSERKVKESALIPPPDHSHTHTPHTAAQSDEENTSEQNWTNITS